MGSYEGQAALVLADGSRIEGQVRVRTRGRRWEGTLTVASEHALELAVEATAVELPGDERRAIVITGPPSQDGTSYRVSFTTEGASPTAV
jgi:hypothetical protein